MVFGPIEFLLAANHEAGTIRPGVNAGDFLRAIVGIWQIDIRGDWHTQVTRLPCRYGQLGAF